MALEQLRETKRDRELDSVRNNADAIRDRCKTLAGFIREAWRVLEPVATYVHSWHIDAICEHLEAVTAGRINRLLINVPPGSSKSLIVSVLWPAWEWGPKGMRSMRYLCTSFNDVAVKRDTRKCRNLMLSEWFKLLWPEVNMTRTGETSFENSDTGTREGVAIGSITGQRGDRFIIDDPHSTKTAESELQRKETTRTFIEGGQNRLNDQVKSAIVIIMQRLHMDDLTGVILKRKMDYVHLMIPMEFEIERSCTTSIDWTDPRSYDGELMDPQRFPVEEVIKLKEGNDYAYAGQYQQRPAPREGGMFKVDKIIVVPNVPDGYRSNRTRGWDIAGSTRKTSPYTVGALLCELDGMIYIEDVKRLRAEINDAELLILTTGRVDGPIVLQSIPQDPGQAGKSQRAHLTKQMHGLNFMFSPETGSKQDRAIGFASQVNAGNVRMVKGDWNAPLIEEMRNFPAGSFMDQIDALSRAYAEIAKDNADDGYFGKPVIFNPTELSAA